MQKKSFEEIRELVKSKYEPLSKVRIDYLNEHGKFVLDVFDELDNCLSFADNLEEYVDAVRSTIEELLSGSWYRSLEAEEYKKRVAKKLRLFVRIQIERELWENTPEFADRKEN